MRFEAVWALVRQVPAGRVVSYGQVAALLGNPRLSRVVGYAMHGAPDDVPCHRVVTASGGLSEAFQPFGRATHRLLLEVEGIPFTPDGRVDMPAARWQPDAASLILQNPEE